MKLVRFGPKGKEKPGLLDENEQIRDLSGHIDDVAGDVLLPKGLAKLSKLDPAKLPLVKGTPRLGPCVGHVRNFIGIGLNYSDHAYEAGLDVPKEPVTFFKNVNSICGPNDDIEMPRGAEKLDWEVELGVVIGKPAKYIEEEDAFDHIAGYCVVHDVSERDYILNRSGLWSKGKAHDTFGPMGPWMVTKDEIDDPHSLPLWLDVNDNRKQAGSTANMIYQVPFLVSYLSNFMSLSTGDVIATGTPAGVGMGKKPPEYLNIGDTVSLSVHGLGEQTNKIVEV